MMILRALVFVLFKKIKTQAVDNQDVDVIVGSSCTDCSTWRSVTVMGKSRNPSLERTREAAREKSSAAAVMTQNRHCEEATHIIKNELEGENISTYEAGQIRY